MNKFLASDFWLVYNFDDPNVRYQKFLSRSRTSFKRLIENLLLYDSIVLPTQDFLTLTVLIGVFGEEEVVELLKSKSISFLRAKGSIAYIGNGGGIQSYLIGGPNEPLAPFCAPIDEAIDWALDGLSQKPTNRKLPQLVAEATSEFDISKVVQDVKNETYKDIQNSLELRNYLTIRNTDLDKLAGVGPKGVRIFGGKDSNWQGDEIDIVMSLTSLNLELMMMGISESNDAITENPIRLLLEAKARRVLERSSEEAFTELKEISDIPDIGEGVLQKKVSLHDVLKITNSSSGRSFRKWFHENCRKDTITTAKEYANVLKQVPAIQKFPARVLRFIMTNLAGFVNPGVGIGAGVVDSFFIDKILRGSSPKFFIDELEKI